MNPTEGLTISALKEKLIAKEFSALENTQAFFERIKEHDKKIGAFLALNEEQALRTAEEVDILIAKGEQIGELAGVPLAIKDNITLEGLPATAGSKLLERYTAAYDAGVVKRLKTQHAIILGKTNLDEFGMGSSTENSAFQITRNPHDPKRVPGGSSGGSAAAVAAGMALGALGSDTGGSIRQPAAFCGVVGLKPTYGAVSRSGLIALASSLDQIGPLTRTVKDAALLFRAITGHDPLDATSTDTHYEKDEELIKPSFEKIKNLTVGIPKEYFIGGIDAEVSEALDEALRALKSLGVKTKEISLPHTKYALSAYYIILPAEASANLARFDGIRYSQNPMNFHGMQGKAEGLYDLYLEQRGHGFGPEPKRRIILGTFVLSSGYYDAYYAKAQKVRRLIAEDFKRTFEEVDVLFTPTTPTTAFALGEKTADPLSMYLSDIFTIPANLAGVPAISIPVRPTLNLKPETSNLPVGFQLIGRHFREADILGLGQYYEKLS